MVMANWVCSRYWPSEQWSTDGELASPTQLGLQPKGGLAPSPAAGAPPHSFPALACVVLYVTLSYAAPL